MSTPAYGHALRHDPQLLADRLSGVVARSYWIDSLPDESPRVALAGDASTDLLVVGGGYTGLWAAVQAKERNPYRRVILIEQDRVGAAASGRNGGFCEPTLTHGSENGRLHWPSEMGVLDRLAESNFAGFRHAIEKYAMDAEFELSGMLTVATEPHQVAELEESGSELVRGASLRSYVDSPLYRAGFFDADVALVHPAKLARELARVAEQLGVEIHEGTRARALSSLGSRVAVQHDAGVILADRVALATNGFPALLRRVRRRTVPIYDYVLMSEPLDRAELEAIGWTGRHGITDAGREFHYLRKTKDDRILFGGYDAVYHRGGRIIPAHDQRRETFMRLADHFYSTFPRLIDRRFTHAWGGMIDMSTQLAAFHGRAWDGRVAYSLGYTGLGVVASRHGAATMLDLLDGAKTERTSVSLARKRPMPVPPEPLAYPLIQVMRSAVARSERNGGRDGVLLKVAKAFGVGFDS
jgi:glycine/D-amino acid oxidase-like deaminating enzyme